MSSTVQDKNKLLTSLGFLTDQGDTHTSLDMVKNATISADELKICWIFAGAVKYLDVKKNDEHSFELCDVRNGLKIVLRFPYLVFGNRKVECIINNKEDEIEIAAILYKGERTDINFAEIDKAAAVTCLEIKGSDACNDEAPVCKENNGKIEAEWNNLKITAPLKPGKQQEIMQETHLYRDMDEYKPAY